MTNPACFATSRHCLRSTTTKSKPQSTGEEALQKVDKGLEPDLVLLDVLMPGIDGLQTLEQLSNILPGIRVVMLSCVSDTRKVVQAMKLGAQDYLTKPFQKAELDAVIDSMPGSGNSRHGRRHRRTCRRCFLHRSQPGDAQDSFTGGLGRQRRYSGPLLGESGTGKEVLARLIHKLSPRAHRTFLKVNCAAVPGDLLESELFGYEPGAFTGATHAKPGKFELCNKGTILLDEIGEMPPMLQAKLLHVLQDQQFSRLGSRNLIKVDVRILAATNIDIPRRCGEAAARRSLLSVKWIHDHVAAATRTSRRDRHPLAPFRQSDRRKLRPPIHDHFSQAARSLRTVFLAGQSSRVGQLRKAFPDSRRRRDGHPGTASRGRHGHGIHCPTDASGSGEGGLKGLVRGVKDEAEIEAITRP